MRKLLSLILCLTLCMGLLPAALAEDPVLTEQEVVAMLLDNSPELAAFMTPEEVARLHLAHSGRSYSADGTYRLAWALHYDALNEDTTVYTDEQGHFVRIGMFDEDALISTLNALRGANVTACEAQDAARRLFAEYAAAHTDDPFQQAYLARYRLNGLTGYDVGLCVTVFLHADQYVDTADFCPRHEGQLDLWQIGIYPLAEVERFFPDQTDMPPIRWHYAYVCMEHGTAVLNDLNGWEEHCFRSVDNWDDGDPFFMEILDQYLHSDGDLPYLPGTASYSLNSYILDERWPLDRFFPDLTQPQIIWRAASLVLTELRDNPYVSAKFSPIAWQALYKVPEAAAWGRTHDPETYALIFGSAD